MKRPGTFETCLDVSLVSVLRIIQHMHVMQYIIN